MLNIPDGLVDRPVIDETQLTRKYILVVFQRIGDVTPIKIGNQTGTKIGYQEPVAEALKSQLGLMLVKATGPYRIFSVTHISRPAPQH